MKTKDLIELLAGHADALNRGQDTTAALLTYKGQDAAELAPMLWLARSIKTAMEPMTPSAAFKASLHQQIVQGRQAADAAENARPIWWIGAAAVGSLLSVAGLMIWLLRRPRPEPQPATKFA
jgi:hypothetical protein